MPVKLSFRCEVILVPSCAWLCIRLPDTVSKSHIGASHTGSRTSRLLHGIAGDSHSGMKTHTGVIKTRYDCSFYIPFNLTISIQNKSHPCMKTVSARKRVIKFHLIVGWLALGGIAWSKPCRAELRKKF